MIDSYVQRTKASGDDKVRDFWRQILSSERIAGTTFQHIPVILNLLEGGSEQLRRCVPGEASDTRFYPKPGWFTTDQATKSRRIIKNGKSSRRKLFEPPCACLRRIQIQCNIR